ncbi:MAG: molybdopterin-binding protein [Oscillospiraceae bacterium]
MLNVCSLEEARRLLSKSFPKAFTGEESVSLSELCGRILSRDVVAEEFVPGFARSTVDGYAVHAADTFGCSDAIPALLVLKGEVTMGSVSRVVPQKNECCAIPTGGAMPTGCDAAVMAEHTEMLSGGMVAVLKASAPGNNVIFKGDDVKPGEMLIERGTRLSPKDIGSLAAAGAAGAYVYKKPRIAVISTGDELAKPGSVLKEGQIRDVNQPMLAAALAEDGAKPICSELLADKYEMIRSAVVKGAQECDAVLLSGGTSVGEKDSAAQIMRECGEVLLHGLALKPGKPTLLGKISGKPVFGLPGNPVAALFVYLLLVRPWLYELRSCELTDIKIPLRLSRAIPSNNGREECVAISVDGEQAVPIASKSGLITTLKNADGYVRVPRDCEGLAAGALVEATILWR